jgi:hypothetical protein
MDLGTVRSNLSQNNYDTLEAAANDVRQVFKNCCKVRGSGLWGREGMERGERREERRQRAIDETRKKQTSVRTQATTHPPPSPPSV